MTKAVKKTTKKTKNILELSISVKTHISLDFLIFLGLYFISIIFPYLEIRDLG